VAYFEEKGSGNIVQVFVGFEVVCRLEAFHGYGNGVLVVIIE